METNKTYFLEVHYMIAIAIEAFSEIAEGTEQIGLENLGNRWEKAQDLTSIFVTRHPEEFLEDGTFVDLLDDFLAEHLVVTL